MVFFLMGLFSIFLYTFAINCVTTGARKKPIEYMFCFICSEQCIKIKICPNMTEKGELGQKESNQISKRFTCFHYKYLHTFNIFP